MKVASFIISTVIAALMLWSLLQETSVPQPTPLVITTPAPVVNVVFPSAPLPEKDPEPARVNPPEKKARAPAVDVLKEVDEEMEREYRKVILGKE